MPTNSRDFITVVSGLPRSGTSLMMQMLHAGGVPPVTDSQRLPDEDNPRGYLEFERVKNLKSDKAWLAEAVGKSVKIIHLLLMDLPPDYQYRVVFMDRDLSEVVKSQTVMLQRSGKAGAAMDSARLAQVFGNQLVTVKQWLEARPNFKVLQVNYADLVSQPQIYASQVCDFLGGGLTIAEMVSAVDPALYRNRAAQA